MAKLRPPPSLTHAATKPALRRIGDEGTAAPPVNGKWGGDDDATTTRLRAVTAADRARRPGGHLRGAAGRCAPGDGAHRWNASRIARATGSAFEAGPLLAGS